MNSSVMQTHSQDSGQAGRIIAFTPPSVSQGGEAYRDSMEHLGALELEASLILAVAYLKRARNSKNSSADAVLPSFPLISPDAGIEEAQSALDRIASEIRLREAASIRQGVHLNFISLCDEWGLDSFERRVVMMLLMQYIATDFISLFGICKLERGRGNGMEIGTLLALLCPDLMTQLDCRCYFSITNTLLKDEIIVMHGSVDDTTNILDETVCLHERLVRHILGDNNLYNTFFKYIKREKGNVSLDQVILPEQLKCEVVDCVESYLEGRITGRLDSLDEFYGYGTGLTMLFHGPSGTGKTMLARALATRFNRSIFTLSVNDMDDMPGSYEDILGTLFREAALQGAVVFLDECDDLFKNNSRTSRSLLIEIEKARCLVIMATNKPVDMDPALERRITMKVNFHLPDEELRLEMWQALIPPSVQLAADTDLREMASRYHFSGGLIRNTILLALTSNGIYQKRALLTAAALHGAAACQAQSLTDEQGLCRQYAPLDQVDHLSLRIRQRNELKNLAVVWSSLKHHGTGLALIISASDIAAGIQAANGLANSCGLKVRSFDYQGVMSLSQDDRIIDPVSQRKVTPLDYAFSPASCDASMTLFIDHEQQIERSLKDIQENKISVSFPLMLARIREFKGLFCLVTGGLKSPKLPSEINLHINLEHPAEELQIRKWEGLMGGFEGREEPDVVSLVEAYPLHLSEIEFVFRQAHILSSIRRMESRPGIVELKEVLEGYRNKRKVGILFGGSDIC